MKPTETELKIKQKVITLYLAGEDIDTIVNSCHKSKRTVYRYIQAYEDGTLNIDMSQVAKKVAQFKEEEAKDIFDILKSNSYANKVAMALEKINSDAMDKEIEIRGIRGVTNLIGVLIDKRLKSYTVEIEKENLKLKQELASNSRVIQFVGEEPVYELDNKLSERNIKDIS